MKKVIIITYYEAPNYGAFLQAYAMQSFLKQNGVDAYICNHIANKKNIITAILDKRCSKAVLEYRERIQNTINKSLDLLNITSKTNDKYELAIIGSDEVWNVKNLTALHLPLFFKPYKLAKKTISYAACAGNAGAKHLRLLPYTKKIAKLDAVSVRDDNTECLIKEYLNITPERTLDPTFLYGFEKEVKSQIHNKPYLFVYTYGLDEAYITEIKNFAKNNSLRIIATGSICEWADKNPMPDPFEWLSYIKNSSYVITSTFHGSVFSIKFRKQFITVNTSSGKIKSLLNELKLSDRLVDDNGAISNMLTHEIDYSMAYNAVNRKTAESKAFVLDQL